MWRWLDVLFPPRADEALLRDISLDDFLFLLAPRVVDKTAPHAIALLPFTDAAVRAAIHEAKYRGSTHAFDLLAATLREYLYESDTDFTKRSTIVVPVPLGATRKRERGFNQVETVVRQALNQHEFILDAALLIRTRETASQVSLSRLERESNMRGAFRAAHTVDPSHLYIVVDDVVTTGATLQAAVHALTAAGATSIIPLALAH